MPIDVIEMALETAEKYNVRIGKEIHFPIPIKRRTEKKNKYGMSAVRDFRLVEQIIDLKTKTGTKYLGLVPDFGIFQHRSSQVTIDYERRNAKYPEEVDFIVENCTKNTFDDLVELVQKKYPDGEMAMTSIERISLSQGPFRNRKILLKSYHISSVFMANFMI